VHRRLEQPLAEVLEERGIASSSHDVFVDPARLVLVEDFPADLLPPTNIEKLEIAACAEIGKIYVPSMSRWW